MGLYPKEGAAVAGMLSLQVRHDSGCIVAVRRVEAGVAVGNAPAEHNR